MGGGTGGPHSSHLKNLSCYGDGGAIFCKNDALEEKLNTFDPEDIFLHF